MILHYCQVKHQGHFKWGDIQEDGDGKDVHPRIGRVARGSPLISRCWYQARLAQTHRGFVADAAVEGQQG
jgi:hypothetical protein